MWSCVLIKCRPSWIHFFMNERLQKQIWRAFTHPTNALLCIFFVDIDSNGNPKMQISWVELGWSTIKHPLLKWFCFVNRKRRKLAIRRKRGNTRIQFIFFVTKLTKLVNNSSLMAVLCHQEDKKCDNQGKLHCLWQQSECSVLWCAAILVIGQLLYWLLVSCYIGQLHLLESVDHWPVVAE